MTIKFVIRSACPPSSDKSIDTNTDVKEILLYKIIDYKEAAASSITTSDNNNTATASSSIPSIPRKNRKKRILIGNNLNINTSINTNTKIGADLQESTFTLDSKNTHYNDIIRYRLDYNYY